MLWFLFARFIYISAAGADPNSPSVTLRTKWYGEQEVKDIYPDVTILRPTIMYNPNSPHESFVGRWTSAIRILEGYGVLVGDGNGKIQPVCSGDVALAAFNCLKIPETRGQSYDLGGPVIYTYREAYELLFNTCNLRPYMMTIPMHKAFDYYNSPAYTSLLVKVNKINK